ncbi:hypothetical protein [Pseudomonas aeruginosa]|uniref:hypothetical protein n=1 Tax=Pseudomonas aeruginosa TaxID=287 RepID=UPI0028FEA5D1|nr:hypothetical protein [Pseudomonas aeruginosa]MDU0583504.1 hypothetical protein [Pseudomonas aeruginosa]MDU0721569.1 hypothetical protein [Pseudomonas aeruginosa]
MSTNSEKTEYIKARVNERIKHDFDTVCQALEIKPAEQMRELIVGFIAKEARLLGEELQIRITQPSGYDYGAWRVDIKLKNPEDFPFPIVFPMPKLSSRAMRSDPEYQVAWLSVHTEKHEMGGILREGVWRGHLYSNGCTESQNPTSLETVEKALRDTLRPLLDLQLVEKSFRNRYHSSAGHN